MTDWTILWTDDFAGTELGPRWVGGHANGSLEGRLDVNHGVHIEFVAGREYASCAVVTREALVGDFDARLRFTVDSPAQGSTLELAAIQVDPPRDSGLDQSSVNEYGRSRVYDVHGTPPYVSCEFDENDGWRMGWNRGSAQTIAGPDGRPISDNHFNRYGKNLRVASGGAFSGWLRLTRTRSDWTAYCLDEGGTWQPLGEVRQMNLAQAVYLRLGAKHWVKKGAPAPANRISFKRFEVRSGVAMDMQGEQGKPNALRQDRDGNGVTLTRPIEVRLVQQVRTCRACDVFGDASPYGPFLQVRVRGSESVETIDSAPAPPGVVCAMGRPAPAVLKGCRKAPIMLIGINPNLPGHFILPRNGLGTTAWRSGSYRVLPFLDSDQAYAIEHRYAPKPTLELADALTLENLLRHDVTMLVAPRKGRIVAEEGAADGSQRAPERRHARLVLEFDDGTRTIYEWPARVSENWGHDENLAVVRGVFDAGEVVAGFLDSTAIGREVAVRRGRADSYYLNAERLLQAVGAPLGNDLLLGEDMSLHDVIACASPGWDAKWKLPQALIRGNCVEENRWLHQQLEQSAPVVIVVTSREALQLFAVSSLGRLSPALDALPQQAGGLDGLFSHVARNGLWWEREVQGVVARTRIVLAPHISYSDNLIPHSYFNQADWESFQQKHPRAAAWLGQQVRPGSARLIVQRVYGTQDVMVWLDAGDLLWGVLEREYPAALSVLRSNWLDPVAVLGAAVAQELQRRGVALDHHGRLRRNAGSCGYCNNGQWTIGAGCAYGVSPA